MIGNPALNQTAVNGPGFISKFIPALINFGFLAGVVFFFIYFIIGAIQWIRSGGDKQTLENARERVRSSIIGLVVLFALYAILNLVAFFFNITILTLDIAPLVIQ